MTPIDVILTSYARWDLLEITLDSFFKINTFPINNVIVGDDYGVDNFSQDDFEKYHTLQRKYGSKVSWIVYNKRVGQIKMLDNLMLSVKSEYYFTLEDDWEILKNGFIVTSIEVLEKYPTCNMVQLRGKNNINGHPVFYHDGIFRLVKNYMNKWHGWGFNPSVRRRRDYELIGTYSMNAEFIPDRPWESEIKIGKLYAGLGAFTAALEDTYVKHIGNDRGIRK